MKDAQITKKSISKKLTGLRLVIPFSPIKSINIHQYQYEISWMFCFKNIGIDHAL